MASTKRASETTTTARRRKTRARPTPRWLTQQQDLDEVARKRCLMILSVLSGERSVTEAIIEAGISRQSYYEFETRALQAILRALVPGVATDSSPTTAEKRVLELEKRLKQTESARRRAERLLLLTRKVMHTRRPKRTSQSPKSKPRSSTMRGSKPSWNSKKRMSSRPPE